MNYEKVILSDGNKYILNNNNVVETVCNTQHGDWKAGRCSIPEGIQLEVCEVWRNLYGVWVRVSYNGTYYDLPPSDLKYVKREESIYK